jgi:hypothetical protein
MLRKAFVSAFKKLRWRAWVWGSWEMDGTEAELLTDVLSEVLTRELGAELSGMPDMARKMTQKMIYRVVVSGAEAAWKSLMKSIPSVRGPVEAAAGELLGPVFDKEAEIKGKLQGTIEEAASKGLEQAGPKVAEAFDKQLPVVAAIAEAQLNMVAETLRELQNKLRADSDQSASHFESEWGWMKWRNNWQWSGRQGAITTMIYAKLVNDDGANDATRKLAYWLVDDLRLLQHSAIVVLRQAIKEAAGESADVPQQLAAMNAAFPDVMIRTTTDLNLLLRWRLAGAIDSMLKNPLMETTAKVIDTATEPLAALIPEMLADIIDPTRTATEIVEDVLATQEVALADAALKGICDDAKQQGAKIAEKGL